MKLFTTIAAASLICAGQVSALSCMQPEVATSFAMAQESDARYAVFLGTFAVPEQPRGTRPTSPVEKVLNGQFSGQALGLNGFAPTDDRAVTITLGCAGPWCASMPEGTPMLAFVEVTDDGYALDIGPCYGNVFAPARPEDIAQAEACMTGGC